MILWYVWSKALSPSGMLLWILITVFNMINYKQSLYVLFSSRTKTQCIKQEEKFYRLKYFRFHSCIVNNLDNTTFIFMVLVS
jgi:carbonic anhydrase